MKNIKIMLAILSVAFLTTSCGFNYAIIENQNQNSTQVHLRSDNYTIVDRVSGSADVTYILFFGGSTKSSYLPMLMPTWLNQPTSTPVLKP